MVCQTNVPVLERLGRISAGIALAAAALFGDLPRWGMLVVSASAAAAVLTGISGFCPMCRLAGRKIG